MRKTVKIVVCATNTHAGIRHDRELACFKKLYGEDKVTSHHLCISVQRSDDELFEIQYRSIKSINYDGFNPNEFELDTSASMLSSMEDISRVLEQLRVGHMEMTGNEI